MREAAKSHKCRLFPFATLLRFAIGRWCRLYLARSSLRVIVFGMRLFGIALRLGLMAAVVIARADQRDLQKQLDDDYAGKMLTLRHFYRGANLRFLPDGSLVGDAAVGPWTLDGRIEVQEARVGDGLLKIKGRRINVVFDHRHKSLDQLATLGDISGKERDDLEKALRSMEVNVTIELPSSNPSEQEVSSAMRAVFLMPGESMMEAVPSFWRKYFSELEGQPAKAPKAEGPIYRVMRPGTPGGVTPPKVIFSPDPEYSERARKAKYQGTVVLWLVVDSTGAPRDIQIQVPLGDGLDEKAVEAVRTWQFVPAEKDGKNVAVMLNVEVSFRLY